MKITLSLLLALMLLPCVAAIALPPEIEKARALHDKGASGDKAAVKECVTYLDELLAKEPKNQLARVYLGSTYTLVARDAPIGPGKMEALKKGGALMDEAVNATPDDAIVRLVRAVNSIRIPAIFGRRELARQDFDKLLADSKAGTISLEPEEKQAVYYFAGVAAKQRGQKHDAKKLWKEALEMAPASQLSTEIKDALD